MKRGATPHQIADTLLRLSRDMDRPQLTGTGEACQLRRIGLVVRALNARLGGDQRRRDYRAGDALGRQFTRQDVPRARGFEVRPERGDRAEPFEIPNQLLEVARQFVDVGRGRRITGEHGDRHGLRAHIEPEKDC